MKLRVCLFTSALCVAMAGVGCTEPIEVRSAALSGSLGELESFERSPEVYSGWNTSTGSSVVRLESDADDGSVIMTRLTVGGGLEAAIHDPDGADLRLLGCSGPDGSYTFDRTTRDVRIEITETDEPELRRVRYWGQFEYEGRAQVVEGQFEYRRPSETAP